MTTANPTLVFTAAAGFAALTAYELAAGRTAMAIGTALVPILLWEFSRLAGAVVLLGLSLPFVKNIAGSGSSVNVAYSDLILAFLFAGVVALAVTTGTFPAGRALRPLRVPLGVYTVALVVLLFLHLGVHEVLQTAQRLELFLVPVIVGAYAFVARRHVQLLAAYVLATTAFAAVWRIHSFGVQKNPAGQLMANAIILLIAYKPLRAFTPALVVLVPGLLLTGSRGAVGALVVGVAVVGLAHPSRGWTLLARIAPLVIAVAAAFTLLSTSAQDRLTTFRSGDLASAQYSIHIRHAYTHDAKQIAAHHPVIGVGVGEYISGEGVLGTATTDPHDVILLQAAEGGYAFALAFALLIAGTTVFLYRARRIQLAAVAAAVMLATVAHGLVDVYWVRGTPVLSWLLVGMACASVYERRNRTEPT